MLRADPFVGREGELRALASARDAGGAWCVLVEGPAGAGKTALVERFLATSPGLFVLRASGERGEADVPLGVVDQLLRRAGGSAVLDLVAGLDGPSAIVVDDAQWADRESVVALVFAARRLVHERVMVIVISREHARLDGVE